MLLSIIIPVYNTGRYIKECIDSILNQEEIDGDVEIICIDDGSTDNSAEILKSYGKKIVCVRKDNGGVSSARNLGIEMAKGEYVWFVDSDDKILPGAIKKIKYVLRKKDTELLRIRISTRDCAIVNSNIAVNTTTELDCHAVSNIYRIETIRANNLRFNESLKYGEDTLFLYTYYSAIEQMKFPIIVEPVYYYRLNDDGAMSGSVTEQGKIRRINDLILQCCCLKDILSRTKKLSKKRALRHKIKIETECLLYLLPAAQHEYGDIIGKLKEEKLYPYFPMVFGIFERKKKGYGIKNAISFYAFPFECVYKTYYKIRKKHCGNVKLK